MLSCRQNSLRSVMFSIFLGIMGSVQFCNAAPAPPFVLPPSKELARLRSAVIYTDYGQIKLKLFPDVAPWHVANLKYLADKNYYKNTRFHILEPGFLVQGGSAGMSGKSGPGYFITPEFSEIKHQAGLIGMARQADNVNPERLSHGSQFYIMLRDEKRMDGLYTIFAEVIDGMQVVERLKKGDYIRDLKVFVRPRD